MTFQHIVNLTQSRSNAIVLTGEDRFLGYSLLMGAAGALIGMGGALTDLQVALVGARRAGKWDEFVRLSALCDRLGQATFVDPMEGYIQRMLWAGAVQGAVPWHACHDPWGPTLSQEDKERVRKAVRDVEGEWRR